MFSVSSAQAFLVNTPVVAPPVVGIYTLNTFNVAPPNGVSQPDDIAVTADGKDLWVSYGNGANTFGLGGPSNAVEYDIASGSVVRNVVVPGHLDGLKINPTTGDVWTTENEDGNPTLAIISPRLGTAQISTFQPTLVTGGMDDLVITGPNSSKVFIVTSSQSNITLPVIVQIAGQTESNGTVLRSTLAGNPPSVWNVVTNRNEPNDQIGDPDSMTIDPAGELVLDNRSDDSLYIVRSSSATRPVLRVPLTFDGEPVEVNDTTFTTSQTTGVPSTAGTIFITDATANKIYLLSKTYFPSNEVYTTANILGDVALVNLNTGVIQPVVTGFQKVQGLAFSPIPVSINQ